MLSPLSGFKRLVSLTSFAFLYFISSSAHAQIYSSSSTEATGGAGRAGVEVGDVNYLNPASLVHMKGGNFFSDFSNGNMVLGLSEISHDVLLPASFAYREYKFESPAGTPVKMVESRLSIADFVVDRFSMGLTGIINRQIRNDLPYNQGNGDLGFFFTPNDHIGTALVFYNAFGDNLAVPDDLRLQHQIALGGNYVYQGFLRTRFDLVSGPNNDFGQPIWMVGTESLLNSFVVARIGYQNDVFNRRELGTFGFGFSGPRFNLHYAFMGSLKSKEISRHSIDLLLAF